MKALSAFLGPCQLPQGVADMSTAHTSTGSTGNDYEVQSPGFGSDLTSFRTAVFFPSLRPGPKAPITPPAVVAPQLLWFCQDALVFAWLLHLF